MMNISLAPALILLLVAPLPDKQGPVGQKVQYGVMTYRQRIVIRVPKLPEPPRAQDLSQSSPANWKEHKAEKCVPISSIAGVSVSRAESVDLIVADGRRLRARFDDDCPAIDFYAGLYIRRTAGGLICAKRDAIRSRSGDSCRIEAFKELRRKH